MDAFGTGHASGLDSSQHLQGVRLLLIPRQLTAFVDVVHLKMKHGLVEDLDQTRSKCREKVGIFHIYTHICMYACMFCSVLCCAVLFCNVMLCNVCLCVCMSVCLCVCVCVYFDLEMCFAPQRRALFRHRNFQKWSDNGVFCTF